MTSEELNEISQKLRAHYRSLKELGNQEESTLTMRAGIAVELLKFYLLSKEESDSIPCERLSGSESPWGG